jgi:hypothetical protein
MEESSCWISPADVAGGERAVFDKYTFKDSASRKDIQTMNLRSKQRRGGRAAVTPLIRIRMLFREADPPHQIVKAWIGAQRVETRIYLQI